MNTALRDRPAFRVEALYAPAVLDDVDPSMTLVREETFGPVSPAIAFDRLDDAIRICNGTPFGLLSGVCTNRHDAITRFINDLRVGRSTCEKCRAIGSS